MINRKIVVTKLEKFVSTKSYETRNLHLHSSRGQLVDVKILLSSIRNKRTGRRKSTIYHYLQNCNIRKETSGPAQKY